MERRLQILLDEARFRRVAGEAQASGRSVAAVIREAIDARFPDDGDDARMIAARSLLDATEHPGSGRGEGPRELKEAYGRHLERVAGER